MRVVRVRECGAPDVLRVEEADRPVPAAGQVLIAVAVAGVAYGDVIVRSGQYPMPLPYVPGIEVGGRVVEVGPGGDPAMVGRQVVATTVGNTGGYAEFAVATDVHPTDLPLDRAVAVFSAGGLAVGMLAAMRVGPDDTVLVTAAAGRIGSLLVQRAASLGARVVAAASGPAKLAAAREFGAHVTIDYGTDDHGSDDWAAAAGEVTVALDAVGGTIGARALATLVAGRGRFGTYGFTSGTWTPLDARQIGRRGLTVVGPLGIVFAKPPAEQRADIEEALRGDLVPRIHATYDLADAARAHADLEARANVGAVLLTT